MSADPSGVDVVSFQREELDHYLVASRAVLVRIFDFSLLDFSDFDRWSDDPETTTLDSQDLFFRQKIDERASYTRGVQIIRPSTTKESVVRMIMAGPDDDRFAEFTAVDYRHRTVTTISTDPAATTNNFEHEQNDLPFELSPAFFRPEVLSKYKGDRDKYVIDEERRTIRCRGAWSLRYDVNAARQVHAYICDLRLLPFQEQQYWQSFNENPKANISERAFENDFKGTWTDFRTPLEDLLEIVRHWAGEGVLWWTLRDTSLLSNVNTPHSGSRDEWGRAFKDLADLVVAGFEEAFLRRTCDEAGVAYEDDEKSLALLEKVLRDSAALPSDAGLDGLRTVQRIRSVVAAHVRGGQASKLNREALEAYGTYAAHFWHVCGEVAEELQLIEAALS